MRSFPWQALSVAGLLLAVSALAVGCGPSSQPASAPAALPTPDQPVISAPAPGAATKATGAGTVPGPGGQGTPKRGGIVHVTQVEDPPCWDVHCTSFSRLTHHSWKTHSKITRYDYNGKPGSLVVVSDLAEKWDVSPDTKVWTFYLRKGVKFHNVPPVNGREFVAEDVRFSMDRIMNGPTSIWHGLWDMVEKIEVVDKYTIRFILNRPYASFLNRTSEGDCCWMVAKEVVSQPDYGKDPKKSLIGTGPFLFNEYNRGVSASEKRNPDYFGLDWPSQIPYLDGTETLIVADAAARLAAFVSQQIEITSVPIPDLPRVKTAIPNVQLRQGAGNASSNGLSINTTRAPFDNVKVRQALQYGVSQQTVIDGLFKSEGKWHGFMGSDGTAWALPLDEVKQLYKYDPDQSKKLLAEAGFATPIKSDVIIATGDQTTLNIFEVWKANLEKAGFDITLKADSVAAVRKAAEDGNYTLYMGPHVTAIEPDYVVKDGLTPGGSRNFSRLNDSVINDLVTKQSVIVDYAERKRITDEIQRRVAAVVPLIPWPAQNTYTAAQPYLKNWFPGSGLDDSEEQYYWIDK